MMDIGNTLANGAQAIFRADVGMTTSARTIASADSFNEQSQPQEITEALVNNVSYEAQSAAGVRVVESASDTIGTLLDTRA